MNYAESIAWLESTRRHGIKLGLDNTRQLFEALGSPQKNLRFLHVAGTNGKGSVCAFLDCALRNHGIRTGLYTSPHLVSFRERIQVNGVPISEEEAAAGLTRIRNLNLGFEPTCFEIITALALLCFESAGCEMIAWETGLGGRLDATNVVTPVVCGITRIGLDHQEWLGQGIASIAAEKAGIFKPGVQAIVAPQEPGAAAVLREIAATVDAPLMEIQSPPPARTLAMAGAHQQENAEVAAQILQASGLALHADLMETAFSRTVWPGRFQVFEENLVLDGAHNPSGAAALGSAWQERFGAQKAVLVFGAMQDKDISAIWETLLPVIGEAVFAAGNGPRWVPAAHLKSGLHGVPTRTAASISSALQMARDTARPVLVTGSLFLVGETLSILQGIPQDWADA